LDGFCTWIVDEGPGPECEEDPTTVGDNLEWLAFSPDGSMLAMSGYNSGASGVWDVESGRRLVTFGLAPGEWYNFEFNPTSDLLVGTSGNQLTDQFVVYDTDGWAELASGPDGGLATTFTPDGRYVFVDTWDGVQKIDTTTWQPVGEIMPVDSLIRDIAVSSDGTLIAHGGQSGVVRIRSTLTGELLQEIRLPGAVALIEFVQDRHLLIVPFNRALVMTADTSELVDVARSQVTRGFTVDECATYHIDPCPDLETIRGG
jgi:WD40 repeat protein